MLKQFEIKQISLDSETSNSPGFANLLFAVGFRKFNIDAWNVMRVWLVPLRAKFHEVLVDVWRKITVTWTIAKCTASC